MTRPGTIEVSGLTVEVNTRELLSRINFQCQPAEHLAIIGANGAGKTTLLRSLMGLISHHGSVRICGSSLKNFTRRELARQIAYVPQQLSDSIPFTVKEFVLMGRFPYQHKLGAEQPEDLKICDEIIEQTELTSIANRPLSTLSGGERQRVSIAAALAQHGSILILDEPCSHLDPKQQRSVQALLSEIGRDRNLTILTVTHDLNWASHQFDRVLALCDGRQVYDDRPEVVLQPDPLFEIYQTKFQTLPNPQTGRPLILPFN